MKIMNLESFKAGDRVTPSSPRHQSAGKFFTVVELVPRGRGGIDGRVVVEGHKTLVFIPSELKLA